jgi:hypothetical protein
MWAYDALGSGAEMLRMAQTFMRLARRETRPYDRGLAAVDEGEVELPGELEPWIDLPSPPPTLAGGGVDTPLRWLPSDIDPPDRDALASPIYPSLTFAVAGPR